MRRDGVSETQRYEHLLKETLVVQVAAGDVQPAVTALMRLREKVVRVKKISAI